MKSIVFLFVLFCIPFISSDFAFALPVDIILFKSSNDTIENKKGNREVPEIKFDNSKLAPVNVRNIFNELFKQYLTVKDALAYNDAEGAKRNTLTLLDQMRSKLKDIELLNKDARWLLFLHNYESIYSKVEAADFISDQRFLFGEINTGLQEFIKYYGLYNKTIYLFQCSNAGKNINGTWLSDKEDKKNPYLGSINDTSCTKVKESWVF
ncbi:MAG: DUF3347 domain-containing protein [Ignavibacteria bacterium]